MTIPGPIYIWTMATLTMSDQYLQEKKKRVTFKRAHANQHIKALLKDFYTQIAGKDCKTSQKVELALLSLSKYPLEITSGKECFILQGFDKNLCRYVDEQLLELKTDQAVQNNASGSSIVPNCKNMKMAETLQEINLVTDMMDEDKMDIDEESGTVDSKSTSAVKFQANPNSKFDSVLIALYCQQREHPHRPMLTKKELTLKAQEYSTETVANWSFMKLLEKGHTLIKTELCDGVELYSLTVQGKAVAKNFLEAREDILTCQTSSQNNHIDKHSPNKNFRVNSCQQNVLPPLSSLNLVQNDCPLIIDMPSGSYEIIMLVDKNEPKSLCDQDKNIKIESRSLKVGDVVWVARSKTNSQELILPYILERKRMDDFAASIKDGRFHEQKFRLRKCGLRNVIYLIEDHKGVKHCGLSMATLNQAKANTRVQDGFMIQCTDSLRSTKRFLNMMTLRLTSELERVHLRGTNTDSSGKELMTFEYFNASSSKSKPLTVKELFIKMLVQLKGMSVEKALAITKVYNSPKALTEAYGNCDAKEGELLLANLRFNSVTPKVSPAISKIVYMLFTSKELKS